MKHQVRKLSGAIGAEIHGIDLAHELHPSETDFIQDAWQRHRVLVFRDQSIGDSEHARFARTFGQPIVFGQNADGSPSEVYAAGNVDENGCLFPEGDERAQLLKINWAWHIDSCYRDAPNKGVILRALEVAKDGGDTLFADMESAYATLPEALRRRVDELVCHHKFTCMMERCDMPRATPEEALALPAARHPLVWAHGDGRRSLFLSPPYMERIDGLDATQAHALVDELVAWSTQERFVYRHNWRAGDVVAWDNRWTMHRVVPYDLVRDRRVMRGAALVGTEIVASVGRA